MAYSRIEQETRDLDLFFRDRTKLVHIATAGGRIPEVLAESDRQNEDFAQSIEAVKSIFEIEVNPNLREILGLSDNGLEGYLRDFVDMAKRGFYSYDKTKIGNFDDGTFHLVARPKGNHRFNLENALPNFVVEVELPVDFDTFNLFKVFGGE
jgi:hypothetical protein